MVKIRCSHCQASGSIPDWGTEILKATHHSKNNNNKKKTQKTKVILCEFHLNEKRIARLTELSV